MTAIQLTSASVHDNLIALINESSQKEVKSQQVTFNDFATNGEDATVIVSAVEGEGYYNGDEYPSGMLLHYSRVHMHRAANTPVWVMDITTDTTFADLAMMVAIGLSVPHDDIQRMSYDMVSGTERTRVGSCSTAYDHDICDCRQWNSDVTLSVSRSRKWI